MKKKHKAKLTKIITIAQKLSWFRKSDKSDEYPLMQASEVEKCILMALDDDELKRFDAYAAAPASLTELLTP